MNNIVKFDESKELNDFSKEQEIAEDLAILWKGRLNLLDWDITVQIVDREYFSSLGLPDNLAHADYDPSYRDCKISILHPKFAGYCEVLAHDETSVLGYLENKVIHELVHLLISPFTMSANKSMIQEISEERVVLSLTDALLDRNK